LVRALAHCLGLERRQAWSAIVSANRGVRLSIRLELKGQSVE